MRMHRILVVEDEGIVALNVQNTLTQLGYEVVGTALTSSEAIHLAAMERPDVILMDINLGTGADGIETAAQLSRNHDIPVIFLTAYSDDATLARARSTAPYGYLLKPFSSRELHATVQMALERHRSDLAMSLSEERLRLACDAADIGVWDLDFSSDRMDRVGITDHLLGVDTKTFNGTWTAMLERVAPDDREAVRRALVEAVDNTGLLSVDFRSSRTDGAVSWLRVQARSYSRPGAAPRLIGIAQDITAKRMGESALRQAAAVFVSAKEAIYIADNDHRMVAVNEAFSAVTGHKAEDVIGTEVGDWLLCERPGEDAAGLFPTFAATGHWQGELTGLRSDGERFPAWLNLTRVEGRNDGETEIVGVLSDIGALRRAEEQLLHLAHHDPLTGLPNRLLAMDRLDRAIERSRRNRTCVATIMVDLDNFKRVNDTLGHAAGDELLGVMASRLKCALRLEDTVARIGGDEFVLILERAGSNSDIARVAENLLRQLSEPLMLMGCEISPCASLGVSVFPADAEDRDGLLRAADAAMYVAKNAGGDRFAFYAPGSTDERFSPIAA